MRDRYVILEAIDSGGFGDVFRALDTQTNQIVAIKRLREYQLEDARHRFEREVRLLRSYQGHPGIMRLLDADLLCEQPYYVMPLMSGGNLGQHAGRLEPSVVREVAKRLAEVLAYVHENGGVYRDMKLDNILLDGSGRMAVGDFGLGNDPRYTVAYTLNAHGTPGHIAPELLRGFMQASSASDMYGLGATLFHLVTGVHPAQMESLGELDWVAVPDDLQEMIIALLNDDPARRPRARQLVMMLDLGGATGGFVERPAPPSPSAYTAMTQSTSPPPPRGPDLVEQVLQAAAVVGGIALVAGILDALLGRKR